MRLLILALILTSNFQAFAQEDTKPIVIERKPAVVEEADDELDTSTLTEDEKNELISIEEDEVQELMQEEEKEVSDEL